MRLARIASLLGCLGAVLGLSACAQFFPNQQIVAEHNSLAAIVDIPNVPHYPQLEDQCGPASLATLIEFQRSASMKSEAFTQNSNYALDSRIEPSDLKSRVYIPKKGGSLAIELKAQLREFDLLPYELAPSLLAILRELEAGNPVLVFQNLGLSWIPKWHFAVAVGYDLNKQVIVLRSGLEARREMPLSLFEKTWRRGGAWSLLAMQPNEIPVTALANKYFQSALELEELKHLAAAKAAYGAAIQRWPQRIESRIAMSNLQFTQGEFKAASETLVAALAEFSRDARVWNNLAYSLSKRNCQSAAIDSALCALELGGGRDNYWHTLSELRAEIDSDLNALVDTEQCAIPKCPYPAQNK